jgi:hypothetical protein
MASSVIVGRIDAAFSSAAEPPQPELSPELSPELRPELTPEPTPELSPELTPELVRAIDEEIVHRQASRVPWRRLEMCFKWLRVQEYLVLQGVQPGDVVHADVRTLLRDGRLGDVEYNAADARVTRLGVHGM